MLGDARDLMPGGFVRLQGADRDVDRLELDITAALTRGRGKAA
jgi:hypothetical protein